MKIFALAIRAAACFLLFASAATAQPGDDAQRQARLSMARNMANTVLTVIKDPKKRADERAEGLERGFINLVDTKWIAQFVLGQSWKSATNDQKRRYTQLYSDYLAKSYVSTYAETSQRRISDIKILGLNEVNNSQFSVRTAIVLTSQEHLNVDYLVREDNAHYQIIDVIIEGVSLLLTHRAEFTQLAAKHGIDGVIGRLQALTTAPQPSIAAN